MKKLNFLTILLIFCYGLAYSQTAYNPFTQNIHFAPEPTAAGFECGSVQTVVFTQGLTTSASATQWATAPLTVTICLQGFEFNGPASSVVSGSYASNFNWAYVIGSPGCIIGTQNQTLAGTGSNPAFPNPASSGSINLSLKVPNSSPVGTTLKVDVTLQVPAYMALFNSVPDDNESTQTQTYCGCYVLTDAGTVAANQSFCVSGDPAAFTSSAPASGGSGGIILYQWQNLVGATWTDIPGATSLGYDAPTVSNTTQYRRNAKRSLCGGWISSNVLTVTINSLPVVDAGSDHNLDCNTTSALIGTADIPGNSYAWSPSTGLSANNIAQPTANPSATTVYTVTVTGANGCTASDVVTVNVNTVPPVTDAGSDKFLTCSVTSAVIGTAAVAGNSYSWSPALGLSATNIAQPTANPSVTTSYTVTVTGSNGCTATDVVLVDVNTAPPVVNAGTDRFLNCNVTLTVIGTSAIAGNSYSWSPSLGLSNASIAQPNANPSVTTTYTVTVTGTNGCTATDVVIVNVDTTPPVADAGTDKNLTCSLTSEVIGSAAIAGNSYSWSPATALSATNVAQPTANPSATTSYTVTVTGTNGCTSTDVVTVNVNTVPPVVDAGTDKNLTCTTTSATIGSTAIAGNTYAWSPATGLSATNIAQPVANPSVTTTYTVTVTGTNGCTATDVVVVNVNTVPPVTDAGSDAFLTCSTTSAIIGTSALPGHSYSWSPSLGLSSTNVAQPTASPAATTSYTVTVTGTNGCTLTDVVVVNVNTAPPVVDAGTDKNLNCTNTSSTIGTAAIAGNSYSWSPSIGLSATNIAQPIANPLSTTNYTVTVTGTNGCTATDVVTVNVDIAPPTVDAGSDRNLNCNITSAIIGTSALAGNSYSWSPSTGLSATNIAQPTANPSATTSYTVTVTGTNGCTSTDVVLVNVNTTPPTVDAGFDKNLNCTTTSSSIGTTSIPGYSYSWSPATGLSATNIAQPIASPLSTTTYTVTVTGTNGCTATDVVVVNVNTVPPVSNAGPDQNLNCSITAAIIGNPAIAGNTYSWSPATGLNSTSLAQPIASPTSTETYTLTVTGANGCTSTSTVTVFVNTAPPIADAGTDKNLNCNVTLTTIGTPANSGDSYSWSPSIGLSANNIAQPIANPSATTTYTLTVTGANGCTATDVVVVNVNTTPPVTNAGVDRNLNCTTTSAVIGTISIPGNTYSWSPATGLNSTSIAQPTATPSTTTTYTVLVTGSNGCTSTDVVVVNVNTTLPIADAGLDKNLTCASPSTIIGTTGIAGNSYVWNPSTALNANTIAQPIANPVVTTVYTVTVTGSNGCTATDAVIVNVNNTVPTITITGTPEVCNGSLAAMTATTTIGTIMWSNGSSLPTQNLSVGTYTVTADNGGCTSTATVTVVTREGTVGNYVWNDANADGINNEPISSGINGVPVQLWNVGLDLIQGNADDQLYASTNTANNTSGNPGYYNFIVCIDGNYYVKFPLSTNANDTLTTQTATPYADNNSDANKITGNSPVFSIQTNGAGLLKDNNTIDAGYVLTLSLGNSVWNDLNKNGVKDGAEPGLSGASVKLYNDVNNDGVPDGAAIATTTTNASGLYIFNELLPGNYLVGVTPPAPGSGNNFVSSVTGQEVNPNLDVDNNDNGIITAGGETLSGTITLLGGTEPTGETPNNGIAADNSSNLTIDFGFYQPVSIYGNVFNDITGPTNVDGLGLGSATGIQLYVNLLNSSGIVVAVVPVNANGTYTFTDVMPSTTYSVLLSTNQGVVGNPAPAVSLPTGWENVAEDCCDNTGNDGSANSITTIVLGTTDVFNANFGIRQPMSVGNSVWLDFNKNGIKDPTELGIQGATINLYVDANNDGVPDGPSIATTVSNVTGDYVFNGLNTGNYLIGVIPPAVAGGTYASSVTGQEVNPNLDVDNNDNGIITNAGETLTGTITLVPGTEPGGELPNNALAPDLNANLTIDFGFFVCPNNFTFNPIYVCPGNTTDLLALEPANYTGGVWTDNNNVVVSNTNVSSGVYNYTYTNGTCIATGSVSVEVNIPDYTPTISIAPSAITGTQNVRVILTITELLNRTPCSDVYVLVPKLEPRYTFTWDATATSIGGIAVSNADWQFYNTNPNFYVWQYVGATAFPGGTSSKLGFLGPYNPNQTDGETSYGVQVFQGSGGESNIVNNTDSEVLIYFR
ncbi:MAG: hypothetical protein IPI46_13245 [Bacteroidetes bacterium]|nr:hypothetical protein [Bacteroidota bacterium]